MHFPPPTRPSSPHPRTGPPAQRYVPPPPRNRRWGLRLGILGALVVVLGGATAFANVRYLPDAVVLPGLRIDGEEVRSKADANAVRAHVQRRADGLLARKVRISMPGTDKVALESSLGDLGLKVDVDETTAIALRAGKSGDLITRGEAARDAREGKTDVPLVTTMNAEAAMRVVSALKEAEDAQPVSARLDLDKHATIPEKEGRYIDADGTIAAILDVARDPRGEAVKLPVAMFAPRISASFLKSLDITTVVAEYETSFSRGGDQQRRGKNIDNASQKLDGLVVSPGEMISFNEVIGERSEENGFQKSWEIFKGEMVEGVGGGTCQVASTFHAATFFGGFDVLERLPHSRPSAYIPMGLDSTVVYPGVDLKVRNPHPFPVVVHAKTVGNKLRVELLGKARPVEVSFGREVLSTIAYKRKVEEDPALSGKKVVVKQHGIKGYKIKRKRLFTYADGTKKKEEMTDTYPPTTEIYKVPVGFDVSLLPPLPAGEGDDSDAPAAAPASARIPSSGGTPTASAEGTSPTNDVVEFVDAPGAHAPTAAQKEPAKTIWLKR